MNKTKLEAEIRKFEHGRQKEKKQTPSKFLESKNEDVNANIKVEVVSHAAFSDVSFTSMVSHFIPNFSKSAQRPVITQVPVKPVETTENKHANIELEDKEEGFIGPRLPRVMTKEEFKAFLMELFPNSDKYK